MNKIFITCLVTAAVMLTVSFVQADTRDTNCDPCNVVACDPCDPCAPIGCGKPSLWFWDAHLEAGIYANGFGQKNYYGDPNFIGVHPLSGNTVLLQNVRQSDAQLNQLYFAAGKRLDTRRGWDVGGRVDFMYGTDAALLQSSGLEYDAGHGIWNSGDYYTAIPQMYFEMGRRNVSVKAGKFLSGMNHESPLSTERFFYSLSDSYMVTPNTLAGIVATWDVNKKLSVFGGWVQGDEWLIYDAWGDGFDIDYMYKQDQFFNTSHNNAFYGGARYAANKRLNFGYTVMIGRDTMVDDGDKNDRNYFVQSFVVNYKPGKRWDYAFEWTLRNDKYDYGYDGTVDGGWKKPYGAYGINQELIYKINKKWSAGLRVEWLHYYASDHDPSLAGAGSYDANGVWSEGENKYNFTAGLNWTPTKRILVRPEVRYDKLEHERVFNAAQAARGTDTMKKHQFSGGVSVVVKR